MHTILIEDLNMNRCAWQWCPHSRCITKNEKRWNLYTSPWM